MNAAALALGGTTRIDAHEIEARIRSVLPGAEIKVTDLTGTRHHYRVEVIAEGLRGLSSIERHRKIYSVFSDVIAGPLHALSLTTRAPGE